jgi:LysR family glycine cleavage system transcriptional activator
MPFPERISSRGWAYWLVFPSERRMIPKIKRFREWLAAAMDRAHVEEDALMERLQSGAEPEPRQVA